MNSPHGHVKLTSNRIGMEPGDGFLVKIIRLNAEDTGQMNCKK